MKSARQAAFEAVLFSFQGVFFAEKTLADWSKKFNPIDQDFRLAQEIAYGSIRMKNHLDERARLSCKNHKLKLSIKQKCLVRTAIYQLDFMTKVPSYAVINESVALAKKIEGSFFANFLNALLRRVAVSQKLELSSFTDKELSLYYSFPELFVSTLKKEYGEKTAINVLQALNHTAKAMARDRQSKEKIDYVEVDDLKKMAQDSNFYIQNGTPGLLFSFLSKNLSSKPKAILDCCASPGGKLLLAHDFFPNAELFANDISEEKIAKVKENAAKYGLKISHSTYPAQDLKTDRLFDLIIADIPCSNTGVFNKRVEARWRFSEQNLAELQEIQLSILENALTLLSPEGELWVMTCSILKEENEELIKKLCQRHPMKKRCEKVQLPTLDGLDGGYASAISPLRKNERGL